MSKTFWSVTEKWPKNTSLCAFQWRDSNKQHGFYVHEVKVRSLMTSDLHFAQNYCLMDIIAKPVYLRNVQTWYNK